MSTSETCPFCNTQCQAQSILYYHNIFEYSCATCGKFLLHRSDSDMVKNESDERDRLKISGLLKERCLKNMMPVLLHEQKEDPHIPGQPSLRISNLLSTWPDSVPVRFDRVLMNLGRLSPDVGQMIHLRQEDRSVVLALSSDEMVGILNCLREDELIHGDLMGDGSFHGRITPAGWRRIAEISQDRDPAKHPVFAAMAFEPEMRDVYESAIEPAVRRAGYRITRVDREEYNDYIMDKIFAMIRVAPFVIADFTFHKKGVYFEAGFARGLQIPVISCCREDEFKNAHFDTKQLNHILWGDPCELSERLLNRIMGSIGAGPFIQSAPDNA